MQIDRRLADLRRVHASVVESAEADPADDEHDPDGSTIAFERQQVLALIEAAEADLVALEGAHARLTDGTYGTCERCGQPIAAARLDALPMTRVCVRCA